VKKYNLVICGGTFDLFHKGHKTFIKEALNLSEEIILAITSDLYVKSFKNEYAVEDFETRKNAVEEFLDSQGVQGRVSIISIDDIYGPLLTSSMNPQGIVVTSQTEATAIEINKGRKIKKLPLLEIVVLPMDLSEDGKVMSSTRVRSGDINREGKLYINPTWINKKLALPAEVRSILQLPLGEILKEIPKGLQASKTITIGDVTTKAFNENNINQFLSIVDFMVQRQKKFSSLSDLGFKHTKALEIKNPPGTINSELFKILEKIFQVKKNETSVILIEGEEDLSVLPVLLASPLGFSIFYGQPGEGLVRVDVNAENKEKAYKLVESFKNI